MKDLLRNPIFITVISALLSVLAYVINNKLKNVENDNNDMLKMGLLGGCLGLFNGILMNTFTGSIIEQDFATGSPDF